MTKLTMTCVLGGFAIGLAISAPRAGAAAVYTAAGACQWDEDSVVASFDVSYQGEVTSAFTTGNEHRISCDMPTPGYTTTETQDDVAVYYDDENNGTDMDDAVICNVYTCNLAGSDCNNEASHFSCSTLGGCTTSPVVGYEGDAYLFFGEVDRPALYTTNVSCHIPNVEGAASSIKRLWYNY